jgi:hypothetical protein
MEWVVRVTPRPHFTTGEGPTVPIVQEAGSAPERVWTQEVRVKILLPLPGSNLDRSVVLSVARHYTDWATPAPSMYEKDEKYIAVSVGMPEERTTSEPWCRWENDIKMYFK